MCLYLHTQCTHSPVVVPMQQAHSINAAFSTHAAFILLLRSGYTGSKIPQRNFPFCDRGGQLSEDTRLEDLRSLAAAAAAAAAAAVQGERGGEGLSRSGGGGQGMSI